MTGHAIATAADLPKLVGYKQLREVYGWPKRTIQDWLRDGKFPKPLDLPGRENYWAVDDIVAWLKSDLVRPAVQPDDSTPEQVEDAALALVAHSIDQESEKPLDPGKLGVSVTREISEAEFRCLETEEPKIRLGQLANLPTDHAAVVAATLLHQLRPLLEAVADHGVRAAIARSEQRQPLIIANSNFLQSIHLEYQDGPTLPPPTPEARLPTRHHNLGLARAVVLAVWHLPDILPLISRACLAPRDRGNAGRRGSSARRCPGGVRALSCHDQPAPKTNCGRRGTLACRLNAQPEPADRRSDPGRAIDGRHR